MLPSLGITMGDPAGVGPEIILKACKQIAAVCQPLILGDIKVMEETAARLAEGHAGGLASPLTPVPWHPPEGKKEEKGKLRVLPVSDLPSPARVPGMPTPAGGEASYRYVEEGVRLTQEGFLQGLVTAPINKALWHATGHTYAGHTECLAALTRTAEIRMMLVGSSLRVILVTTHLALAEVPRVLSVDGIATTLRLAHTHLARFHGLPHPRLAVAALNPHAGEGGIFGDEEVRVIAPAVGAAQHQGVLAEGPFPADSLFVRAVQGAYDGVVCLYHDQGLIPLKLLSWEEGVNVTIGLPIIRTSPDHGTAYDIAGQGRADATSMAAAISLAAEMAQRSSVLKERT
jgi:4-phospho-D-threonate 3-dehydrogenase / 4-phospho-D-erythronate 3-dehydrogenase